VPPRGSKAVEALCAGLQRTGLRIPEHVDHRFRRKPTSIPGGVDGPQSPPQGGEGESEPPGAEGGRLQRNGWSASPEYTENR
jgi:hypothetical protein